MMIIKVTIPRHKWLHNTTPGMSRLWTDTNKGCCVGHMCLAIGIPKGDLIGHGYPHALDDHYNVVWLAKVPVANSAIMGALYFANDDCLEFREGWQKHALTEQQRETAIMNLAYMIGFDVTFTD